MADDTSHHISVNEEGYISAFFRDEKIDLFINFLEDRFGITFQMTPEFYGIKRSFSYKFLTLEESINRVFSGFNFTCIYDNKGSIIEIHLLSSKSPPSVFKNDNDIREDNLEITSSESGKTSKQNIFEEVDEISQFKPTKEPPSHGPAPESDPITNFKVINGDPPPSEP